MFKKALISPEGGFGVAKVFRSLAGTLLDLQVIIVYTLLNQLSFKLLEPFKGFAEGSNTSKYSHIFQVFYIHKRQVKLVSDYIWNTYGCVIPLF